MLFVYQLQQCRVQHAMKQALLNSDTRFQKIVLSTKEYENNKISASEIAIEGKMYDVKSVRVSNNRVELLVLNDQNEEHILRKIVSFFHPNNASPKRGFPHRLQQLFTLDYLLPEIFTSLFVVPLTKDNYSIVLFYIVSNHLPNFTPPPELV